IGPVEALRLQAIPDEAGLVGDPLLVHQFVDARHDAHDLTAAGVDADRRTDGIHDVDRFRLVQFPRTRREREGTRRQRTDGAQVDDIALQFGGHRVLEIGGDFGVLAAADQAEFGNAADFRREADAARAVDAAVHDRLDERADILVFDGALVFGVAGRIHAEGHGLVLQVALAALVADRAVQRVVDEQELHHPFAGLLHHRRVSEDFRQFAVRAGANITHAHGAGRGRLWRAALHLDQTHAAVAGNRQTLVETETRNLGPGFLARLQQREMIRNLDFLTVNLQLCHRLTYVLCSIRGRGREQIALPASWPGPPTAPCRCAHPGPGPGRSWQHRPRPKRRSG